MNVNDYISSGIVESYVLGLADEAERAEFESMCAAYEEVRAARDTFEQSLEKQAQIGAVLPPPQIKNKLFAELSKGDGIGSRQIITEPLREPARVVSPSWIKYVAAASVLLLVGSTILNFYLFRQYQDYSERYSTLLASQTELANNNRALQASLDNYQNTIALIKDPSTSVIKMAGSSVPANGSPDPSSLATVYWNRKSAEVYLLVNALPRPAANQQYQLWAIVNGKPVSAGLVNFTQADSILKMTNMPNAQAFAMTLEKTGGSESPQGAMYVFGAI